MLGSESSKASSMFSCRRTDKRFFFMLDVNRVVFFFPSGTINKSCRKKSLHYFCKQSHSKADFLSTFQHSRLGEYLAMYIVKYF